MNGISKLKTAPLNKLNGIQNSNKSPENQNNNECINQNGNENEWGDFQGSNPWGINVKQSSEEPKGHLDNLKSKEETKSWEDNVEYEITRGESKEKLDELLQSKENPMLWEDSNKVIHEENISDDSPHNENTCNVEDKIVETPKKPRVDTENPFGSEVNLASRKKRTISIENSLVRKSVDTRRRESRCINPFTNFENIEDFKYYIRGDSQILFSL